MQELGMPIIAGWKIRYNLDSTVHLLHPRVNQLYIENGAFRTCLGIRGGESAVGNAKMLFSTRSVLNL